MKRGTIIYSSFYEAIKELPKDSQSNLWTAIFEYSFNQNEIELVGIDKTVFTLIKPQLDANFTRFENGKKGGRPKSNDNLEITKQEPNDNLTETEQEANKKKKKNKNKNKKIEKEIEKEKTTFEKTLFDFKEMRKKKGKLLTESAEKLIITRLNNIYPGNEKLQIECLEQSIMNAWSGIFEIKEDKKIIQNQNKLTEVHYPDKQIKYKTETEMDMLKQKGLVRNIGGKIIFGA